MKIKRLKSYRKLLDLYAHHFQLDIDPLEIFLDSTFTRLALVNKLNISQQFEISLKVPVKFVTSTCVIRECEELGDLFTGVLSILKQFKILVCRHDFHPKNGASWCIKKRVRRCGKVPFSKDGRSTLFGLATNDEELQTCARHVSGMPIFFVAHSRFNLEPAPEAVSNFIAQKAHAAPYVSDCEATAINALRSRFGLSSEVKQKKRKALKAPNPLSCKKKVSKAAPNKKKTCAGTSKKKRKRKRIKMTWAFRQVLEKVKSEMGIP
ncbi:unnamed protein product [Dicrocoelium dendriticum]|nr:unnamed protein product [Dicrocoelium dendriticum]